MMWKLFNSMETGSEELAVVPKARLGSSKRGNIFFRINSCNERPRSIISNDD
jgi:hypothetical protein